MNPWIQELREISKRVLRRPPANPRILSGIFLHEITRNSDAHLGHIKKIRVQYSFGDFWRLPEVLNSRKFQWFPEVPEGVAGWNSFRVGYLGMLKWCSNKKIGEKDPLVSTQGPETLS